MNAEWEEERFDDIRRAFHTILSARNGWTALPDGQKETPARAARAFLDMTSGTDETPEDLMKLFEVPCDEMVLVRGIEFTSLCEHHLLAFSGVAHVAYLPDNNRVVGLSKLARLVELYARRLQVQERLTQQVTEALDRYVTGKGAACVVRATHLCMGCRGVRQPRAETVTSSLTGAFRTPEVRAELLSLIGPI